MNDFNDFDDMEEIKKFLALPIEDQLFPESSAIVVPGSVEMGITVIDGTSDSVEVSGVPIKTVRRDEGDFRLGIFIRVISPAKYAGRVAEIWHRGDEPTAPALVRMRVNCAHVWEELEDGSRICFECDERRPAEEGDK